MVCGTISVRAIDGGILIKVSGRANFESAVPLREAADGMDASGWVCFDMSDCTAMDSTFMGVMTMIGLKKVRGGRKAGLAAASEKVQGLLRGLGVLKIFDTEVQIPAGEGGDGEAAAAPADAAAAARTVLEAHRTLVEAEPANEAQFRDVIAFAEEDVRRLEPKEERSGE